MPEVTYVQPGGARDEVDVEAGTTVKDGALDNGVEGIVAECGGNAMCSTCHVYVDDAFVHRLPEIAPDEEDMLEMTASPREANSRLSCQIHVTAELDGLTVQVPEAQE